LGNHLGSSDRLPNHIIFDHKEATMKFDLLIKNGTVLDGTGAVQRI
jgi:hypothetical protein